jgi:hypothetical protein
VHRDGSSDSLRDGAYHSVGFIKLLPDIIRYIKIRAM